MEDMRKASKSLTPPLCMGKESVRNRQCTIAHAQKKQNKITWARGNTKTPSFGKHQWIKLRTGLPSFRILKYTFGRILPTDSRVVRMDVLFTEKHLCPITDSRTECRIIQKAYFFHRITSVTNQTHFRIYKHVSKGRDLFFEMFWNIFSSSKTQQL